MKTALKVIYEDDDLLAIDKPAGIIVFAERQTAEETLADLIVKEYPRLKNLSPPRCGIIHRLDKDTSGVILAAKNQEAMRFYQEQFKTREAEKKYLALISGNLKKEAGEINTLIGRSPRDRKKQKIYLSGEPTAFNKRNALTYYRVLQNFENYTLIEAEPKTGRKHQIRAHLAWLGHPIAGDKLYGFKDQKTPSGLNRQFLHASCLKIKTQDGKIKVFETALPEELKKVLENL